MYIATTELHNAAPMLERMLWTICFVRTGQRPMTVTFEPNNDSAYPRYDTGTAYLKLSYLYSFSRTFMPNLFLSVKSSDASYSQINFSDPSLKSCR